MVLLGDSSGQVLVVLNTCYFCWTAWSLSIPSWLMPWAPWSSSYMLGKLSNEKYLGLPGGLVVITPHLCCVVSATRLLALRKGGAPLYDPFKWRDLLSRLFCTVGPGIFLEREPGKCIATVVIMEAISSDILSLWSPVIKNPSFLALVEVSLPPESLLLINSTINTWLDPKHPSKMAVTYFQCGCLSLQLDG